MTEIKCVTLLREWILKKKTRWQGTRKSSKEATSEQIWRAEERPTVRASCVWRMRDSNCIWNEVQAKHAYFIPECACWVNTWIPQSQFSKTKSTLQREFYKNDFFKSHLVPSCGESLVMSSVLAHIFRKIQWRRLLVWVFKRLTCKAEIYMLSLDAHVKVSVATHPNMFVKLLYEMHFPS